MTANGKLPLEFDGDQYLRLNPDVAAAGMAADVHYLKYGFKEGRRYTPEKAPPEWRAMRSRKLEKLKKHLRTDMPWRERDGMLDYLTDELRKQTRIVDTSAVSSNEYDGNVLNLIEKYSYGMVLDCGSGKRTKYLENVVNYEIVPYPSTDILGVGEKLPFIDETFDAVISVAVLEHVRDPFQCANEIARVLKPGGELYCAIPFLQPLHGYPHHYFNCTPQGIRALFEDNLIVSDVTVLDSTHPIWSLTWILNNWRNGLPEQARADFDRMSVADLIAKPTEYLNRPFCKELPLETQLELASATILTARKPPN